ncbi:phytanoyl-CoA dioxygenase family protein [Pseudoruegeria sp. HB172150]|uniref:phytanoyl-CoA dioxygenase family protein n=1 Tax=Pseudoruegeria sp. HB172150 TaxID=2721164 RepID=UPI0015545A68|nr:phytanoyl-CoA dioxygenase family protein [Pseudoruegeria sp. HB172150]
MHPKDIALLPFQTLAVASGSKSFRHNRVIGSPALNRRGLHVQRVKLAEQIADARRRRLRRLASPEHREMFGELGYISVENALPDELFAAVTEEVETTPFPAREMKQGNAVTRFITLSPEVLRKTPALAQTIRGDLFQGLMRYAGASNTDPLVTLHTVLTNPGKGRPDPQTAFHSDTFHPTSKCWLFLREVEMEDGPFSYVPGSHRMTPGRLEWEYEQSLTAREHVNGHHSGGSFRASEDELRAMGYPAAVPFPVKANTLVVADTHGFHARQPSARPSTRLALYASLRVNPFNPLAGPDIMDLPGLRGRKAQLLDMYRAAEARISGKKESQPLVGEVLAASPAVR